MRTRGVTANGKRIAVRAAIKRPTSAQQRDQRDEKVEIGSVAQEGKDWSGKVIQFGG
jgi:hypothetical protein